MANPRTLRRVGVGVSVAGAAFGGLATGIRRGVLGGGPRGTETYLLDVAAVLICVAGVVVEARALDILIPHASGLRRQSVVQLAAGAVLGLIACLAIPAVRSEELPGWAATGLAFLVYLGGGRALGGAAGVALALAPGYLEGRIDDRLDEPW